jgi:hypothetical protein
MISIKEKIRAGREDGGGEPNQDPSDGFRTGLIAQGIILYNLSGMSPRGFEVEI